MVKNNCLMLYANYLIILSVCIDQGDGRWKERDKENLRHDIMAYKKMAEKLKHEIEAFYEEYPDEWLSDNIDRIHYKYLRNLLNRNTETTKDSENKDKNKLSPVTSNDIVHEDNSRNKSLKLNVSGDIIKVDDSINDFNKDSDWPKFEDILLAIGRKYDWKNDRWIKINYKPRKVRISNDVIEAKDDKVDLHDKHKFSYRIVKLNRSKSRRNVVVAVSAVR